MTKYQYSILSNVNRADRKKGHLHNTVGPSLPYPVPRPNIMPIFCQLLYQLVLIGRQFDVVEIQGGRLVSATHHVAGGETNKHTRTDRNITKLHTASQYIHMDQISFLTRNTYVLGSLIFLRFSSAFSSPMPTWQPRAKRVLWDNRDASMSPYPTLTWSGVPRKGPNQTRMTAIMPGRYVEVKTTINGF